LAAGARPGDVESFLEGFFEYLRRLELNRQDTLRVSSPKAYDGHGQPIDLDAQVAKAEAARDEKARRESEEEYRRGVERRATSDELTR
jgi:hypothetical protein